MVRTRSQSFVTLALLAGAVCLSACSRERQVCKHANALMSERLSSLGVDVPPPKEMLEDCLELKEGNTDEEWNTFLDCAEAAKEWGEVEVCVMELGMAKARRELDL